MSTCVRFVSNPFRKHSFVEIQMTKETQILGDAIAPFTADHRLEIPRQCPWFALPAPGFGWPPPRFACTSQHAKNQVWGNKRSKEAASLCNLARAFLFDSFFQELLFGLFGERLVVIKDSISLLLPDFLPERLLPKDVFPKFALYQGTSEETPHPPSSIAKPTPQDRWDFDELNAWSA